MRKFLEQLLGAKEAEAKADVPAFLISRQCDGERLDSAHWREVALMSFDDGHKPLA